MRTSGFDAAGRTKEDDTLQRWGFAKEILGIATTSPKNWSVRIGVYGDWGSGKTTVLNFVETMGRRGRNLVVWFNPWEFRTPEELWSAFVTKLFEQLESQMGSVPGRKKAAVKKFIADCSGIVDEIATLNAKTGAAAKLGLPLLKRYTALGKTDVKDLPAVLGDRRLLILIDDLDRTDPTLVPQLLYALKEILDLPGFCFVLAFDPGIVGKALQRYHEGFGEGAEFLDKIIDYPRWLPPPGRDRLLSLARREISDACPQVDITGLDRVIDLLPSNPRALRRYVRHLALLSPQIARHGSDELNWPVILAANALKVAFPRFSHELFSDDDFWRDVVTVDWLDDKKEGQARAAITEKVEQMSTHTDVRGDRIQDVIRTIEAIVSFSSATLLEGEDIRYQTTLAERPHAVTWKEFNSLLARWPIGAADLRGWMQRHAEEQDQPFSRLFDELFDAAVDLRLRMLGKAADGIPATEMGPPLEHARSLLQFLSVLTFDIGRLGEGDCIIGMRHFRKAAEMVYKYAHFRNTRSYIAIRSEERRYVVGFARQWRQGTAAIVDAIDPWSSDPIGPPYEEEARKIRARLSKIVLPRFADDLIDRLREAGFIAAIMPTNVALNETRMLLDQTGILWQRKRKKALRVIAEGESNHVVQDNMYHFLALLENYWLKRADTPEGKGAIALLSDKEVVETIWQAVTARTLNPRAVGSLSDLPERIHEEFDIELKIPKSWSSPTA